MTLILPVLFLATACGQGGGNGNGNDQNGKDTTKNSQSKADKEDKVKLHFPLPSPKAYSKQMVGVTKAKISYYRPSVSDPNTGEKRQIWGDLVPYDTMWRTGANANTTIKFTDDVMINGNKLEAGKYSFFTIPGKDEWTLIFNTKSDHNGTMGYSKSRDALRVKVKPQSTNYHEMMTFHFQNVTDSTAKVVLAWKETAVPFNVSTNTNKNVMAMINKAIDKAGDDDWKTYYRCADYLVEKGKMMDKAEEWINKSIDINENWRNLWGKAQLMEKKGNIKEAISLAEKSLKTGKNNDMSKGYQEYMKGNIKELKEKMKAKS